MNGGPVTALLLDARAVIGAGDAHQAGDARYVGDAALVLRAGPRAGGPGKVGRSATGGHEAGHAPPVRPPLARTGGRVT